MKGMRKIVLCGSESPTRSRCDLPRNVPRERTEPLTRSGQSMADVELAHKEEMKCTSRNLQTEENLGKRDLTSRTRAQGVITRFTVFAS
jgi:hypothetical protein